MEETEVFSKTKIVYGIFSCLSSHLVVLLYACMSIMIHFQLHLFNFCFIFSCNFNQIFLHEELLISIFVFASLFYRLKNFNILIFFLQENTSQKAFKHSRSVLYMVPTLNAYNQTWHAQLIYFDSISCRAIVGR